jgi:hypothetical protein
MENIRQDLVLLRNKAAECELAAQLASDEEARRENITRAKIYRELIEEAERRVLREEQAESRQAS